MRTGAILFMAAMMVSVPASADPEIPPAVDAAVGTVWRSWRGSRTRMDRSRAVGRSIAMTGWRWMSFLAAGNVPDEGKYGLAVRRPWNF